MLRLLYTEGKVQLRIYLRTKWCNWSRKLSTFYIHWSWDEFVVIIVMYRTIKDCYVLLADIWIPRYLCIYFSVYCCNLYWVFKAMRENGCRWLKAEYWKVSNLFSLQIFIGYCFTFTETIWDIAIKTFSGKEGRCHRFWCVHCQLNFQ